MCFIGIGALGHGGTGAGRISGVMRSRTVGNGSDADDDGLKHGVPTMNSNGCEGMLIRQISRDGKIYKTCWDVEVLD